MPGYSRQNTEARLSESHRVEPERLFSAANQERDHARARTAREPTAKWLGRLNPNASASLCEGLEETRTVIRLGPSGSLRRTLYTMNLVESALSVTHREAGPSDEVAWRGRASPFV